MKTSWFVALGVLIVSTTLWIMTTLVHSPPHAASASAPTRTILYYRDPMHPAYTSATAGKAPDCGMDLVPVYADEAGTAASRTPLDSKVIQLSAEHQQMIGLRIGRVEQAPVARTFRTFGRVAVDENRVFPVMAGGEGWVTRTWPGTATGDTVRRSQPLASIYGRDYTTAQRTFLYALRTAENPPPVAQSDIQDQAALTLQEARLTLQNIGFGALQIEELARSRRVLPEVTLTSPASGVITARNASPNQKFDRGAELFRISDLTHVWVVAYLLADDESSVRRGVRAIVSVPGSSSGALDATLTEALPRYDGKTRTLTVRLEADNPHQRLRPNMVVDVEFHVSTSEATTVPADAVVDSGLRKTVFVDLGGGAFESRTVQTGWSSGGRVQIVQGLNPGEAIVVSGTFLLDSESRFRLRATGGHD